MSILLLESIHEDAHALLASYSPIRLPGEALSEPVQAIITRGRGRIDEALLDAHPELQAVARCGAGLDNLDLDAAKKRGIPVVHAPGKTTFAVAEHTVLLMLSMARRLCFLSAQVKAKNWDVRKGYSGLELRGKKLGIIGMGATGKRVAQLGSAFGMDVCYWNRSALDLPYPALNVEQVLASADFVSLHTALTPDTRNMIGRDQLARMKPGAFLINTARGGLVDEQALLEALDAGQLAGYGADLLAEDPPPPDHPLLHHERCVITPHSAVLTDTTYREICMFTAQNVLHILNGTPPDTRSIYQHD